MRRLTRSPWGALSRLALAVLLAIPATAAAQKKHPSLVDPATTKCTSACHEETLKGSVKHPPAEEDCRSCHEFSKKEGGLQVSLSSPEPGLCVTCHTELEAASEGKLKAPHAPVTDTCTSCHSPHSAQQAHLVVAPVPELCVSCHTADDLAKSHKVAVGSASCIACHAPHGSAVPKMFLSANLHRPFAEGSCEGCHRKGLGSRTRLKSTGAALCFACHTKLEGEFAKGFVHGAVKQGLCTGCHSPHVGREKPLLTAGGNDLCFTCHAPIRAKVTAAGAHAAAKKSCLGCHAPHRSDNPRQLLAAVPGLCFQCHAPTDKKLAAKHLNADLKKTNCLSCHDPHGSSSKKLLAAGSVHPPFAEGSCETCHEGSAGKFVEGGGNALCAACHGDIVEAAEKAKFPHGALVAGECIDCHTPHASAQAKLIKAPGGQVCTACHDEKATKAGEFQHGIIGLIGCYACHEPHGGAAAKLLRASGADLCLACHRPDAVKPKQGAATVKLLGRFELAAGEARKIPVLLLSADGQRNHPVTSHRVLGKPTDQELKQITTTFKGELTCLTCHDPHKGISKNLPRTAESGAPVTCGTCHPK